MIPMNVTPLSLVNSVPVDWLWTGRLGFGKLAMLDGDPGLGKSFLTLDLCARLSTGRPFFEETGPRDPACALVLNAEDSEADTIRPRLAALGADLRRIFVVGGEESGIGPPLRLPDHTEQLEHALQWSDARLVVIDPIVAFLDATVCESSDRSVRRALGPLARLAETYHCVILLVRHLNKRSRGRSLYRGVGSIGFLGACRSGWLVARDPKDPGKRVLAQVKNNLAPPQRSLSFALQTHGTVPHLTWLGRSRWTADELLQRDVAPRSPGQPRDRAVEFLKEFLEQGPQTARDVWRASRVHRLSERTLYRARRELTIQVEQVWTKGCRVNYWLLPDQVVPQGLIDADADLEPWLAPLRRMYPPSSPLDELI
jgi:hypothetical protein